MGGTIALKMLIEGIDILTADDSNEYIKNADIGIEDSIISFIAPSGTGPSNFKPDRKISGRRKLAMPGLVNAHTHCAMTLMRNAADDLSLHRWLFDKIFPIEARLTDDDVYWGTVLGFVEMIRSGTTAFADMYLHMEAAAKAAADSKMRVNTSMSPLELDPEKGLFVIDRVDEFLKFYNRWNGFGNGRIRVYMEVHSTYLFDKKSLKLSSELAKELGTGIHIHISETEKEVKDSFKQYGKSPVEVCEETGIFEVPVIGAHLVHVSDDDIEILKEYGINAVHNPTSNLKLASGVARVPEMLKAGVNVALGTDGTASNNNLNMFEEMHLAALIHKGVAKNPELVTAKQAFRMGTVNGAAAIGFENETGVIREGMKADIILLDIDKPHLCPLNDPHSAVVYSAQGSDVDTVIVDGEILMENRELKHIDEERVKFEAEACAKRLFGQ